MMSRQRGFWLRLSFGVLLFVYPWKMVGQTGPCSSDELKASLPSNNPAYPDAIVLSESLSKNGIAVKCMLGSTMDGTFEGQEGAAVYRTDHGDFEVVFLTRAKTFDQLKVIERQEGHRYSYSFKGPPEPWPANRIDSAFRIYFIKNQNMLFVSHNKQMAATLEKLVRARAVPPFLPASAGRHTPQKGRAQL